MFKLDFDIKPSPVPINHQDKILAIGSCFSDNISEILSSFKFDVMANPLGTLYNPHSIFNALKGELDESDIVENQGIYYHWDAHSAVSALSEDQLKILIGEKNGLIQNSINQADWLIITLGTNHVYKLKETSQIVANCHKVPQAQFTKELMQPGQIIESYFETINNIRQSNPNLKVLLTVSPVRHIRDGLHENNISKGILHHAVYEITRQDDKAFYFPGYEIMIDELRDYRFYNEDMIHPSDQAVEYIWQKFRSSFMNLATNSFIDSWTKVIRGINHRAFHPESDEHQKFIKKLIETVNRYESTLDVSLELGQLKNQLI